MEPIKVWGGCPPQYFWSQDIQAIGLGENQIRSSLEWSGEVRTLSAPFGGRMRLISDVKDGARNLDFAGWRVRSCAGARRFLLLI